MHHYEGGRALHQTSAGGRETPLRSGIRPHVRADGELFDVQVDLLDQDELCPGQRASVGVSFLSPHLVHSRIRVDGDYPVLEGSREIGKLVVRLDVWKDPARLVQVGKEYVATVTRV